MKIFYRISDAGNPKKKIPNGNRITSYNVCYTKLLRPIIESRLPATDLAHGRRLGLWRQDRDGVDDR